MTIYDNPSASDETKTTNGFQSLGTEQMSHQEATSRTRRVSTVLICQSPKDLDEQRDSRTRTDWLVLIPRYHHQSSIINALNSSHSLTQSLVTRHDPTVRTLCQLSLARTISYFKTRVPRYTLEDIIAIRARVAEMTKQFDKHDPLDVLQTAWSKMESSGILATPAATTTGPPMASPTVDKRNRSESPATSSKKTKQGAKRTRSESPTKRTRN
ncbi:unnamed protein product [Sympodiomycopsis kandeliae]